MITTCPACHTRFRVSPEQMEAHGGDVRCGRCAKVFNASIYMEKELEELQHEGQAKLVFDEPVEPAALPVEVAKLEPTPDSTPVPAPIPAPVPPPISENEVVQLSGPPEALEEAPPEALEALSCDEAPAAAEALQPFPAIDGLGTEPVAPVVGFVPEWDAALPHEAIAPIAVQPAVEKPAVSASPLVPEAIPRSIFVSEPEYEMEDEPKKRNFFWLWLIGILLLLATAGGQGLYFFRTELAARYPEVKPLLLQLCEVLECTVPLPANPDLLNIETSNLEADPQQANLVTLNAILRNRSAFAQEYPQLELTITNTQDQIVARRVFTPGEYAKHADLARGMTSNEEVAVKLSLDLGDLTATGYRVFLFYP